MSEIKPTALSRLIEPFEGPPQGRFACNAGSMIMLFAIECSNTVSSGYRNDRICMSQQIALSYALLTGAGMTKLRNSHDAPA
jgi:hypothetical protein